MIIALRGRSLSGGRVVVLAALARLPAEGTALAFVLWAAADGRPGVAGWLIAASTLPQLVVGPFMGRCLDRSPRPVRLVAAVLVVTALALGLVGLSTSVGPATVLGALLLALTVPVLTGGISSLLGWWASGSPDPTGEGWGPTIDDVSAWDGVGYNAAGLAAPVLVTLAAAVDARLAFLVLAGSSVMATAVLVGAPRRQRSLAGTAPSSTDRLGTDRPGPDRPGLVDAARVIVHRPELAAVTLATTVAAAGFGALELSAAAAVRARGLSVERAGVVLTFAALGALAGSLAMTRAAGRLDAARVTIAAVAVAGLVLAATAFAPWPGFLAGAFAFGLLEGAVLVGTYRTRHRHSPEQLRASVFTLGASAKLGAGALGALAFAAAVGDRATSVGLVAIGVTALVAAGLALPILGRPARGPVTTDRPTSLRW